MATTNKHKIFNDPIYGFLTIPDELIFDLVEHPYFQRLRRISQMGLAYLVYPGAHHTRFHHALGALHLMQKAVEVLKFKNVKISRDEELALYIAILLHDIGHGPFSHAMERSIVKDVSHEQISMLFMEKLNQEFGGTLSLAIKIFKGEYHRKFMLQLVSSQLDMDRMDYLRRDSFYTGVAEGNINSDRLIQMINVKNETLVMEEKAIYSVEKFLMARRLMYWQAYLHKTNLAAELLLTKTLKRARELTLNGNKVEASKPLQYFLINNITLEDFNDTALNNFAQLDDVDIVSALKSWQHSDDYVLSNLSREIIDRDLPKIQMSSEKFSAQELKEVIERFAKLKNIMLHEASYFVSKGKIRNQAYSKDEDPIYIAMKDGTLKDVAEASDQLNIRALSKPVTKYYMCYPKVVA